MRVGFVRKVGLVTLSLAVAAVAACNDDPLSSSDKEDTTYIFTNPSVMSVQAGVPTQLTTQAQNNVGEPTWEEVNLVDVQPPCVDVQIDTTRLTAVQPPELFLVTGLSGVGQCTITLASGNDTATVEVTNLANGILVVTGQDTIAFGQTVDFEAAIVTADGVPMTPFADTLATWTSSDPAVAEVDRFGMVTGTGVGSATITVCWATDFSDPVSGDPLEYEVCEDAVVEVIVATPTVTGISPASGAAFDTITIQGSGFVSAHRVFIDGTVPANDNGMLIVSVSDTELRFVWPALENGGHEVIVGVAPDKLGASQTFTQTAGIEVEPNEPANDDPGTAPGLTAPFTYVGGFGTGEFDDWIVVTVPADGTYEPILDWNSGLDLDLLLWGDDLTVDPICVSYYSQPENECGPQELTAGTYYLLIEDYSAATGTVFNSTYQVFFNEVTE
jgi:uncharacterized RmlC-like cupin family protein